MNTVGHVRIWLLAFLVFGLLVFLFQEILTPFIAGMAVAYFVDPIADRLEEWGLSRTLATTVLTIAFFILTLGALALLLPVLTAQILGFAGRVPLYFDHARTAIEPLIMEFFDGVTREDIKEMGGNLATFAQQGFNVVGKLIQHVINGGTALIDVMSILVLTPLVTFYMLRDWDVMVAQVNDWLPRHRAEVIREQLRLVDETLAGFVRGQASVCFILGTFYAVALSFLGLEFGLLVGLGAGLISFIPYFGSILGFGVSIAIALVQFSGDWMQIAMVAGVFVFGQAVEGNYLTPKLVGERVGLHPVWVIFALMAGGAVAGFTGVMLAVPIAAVIGVLVRFGLSQYLQSSLYLGYKKKSTQGGDPLDE